MEKYSSILLAGLICCCSLVACDSFEYHPYSVRIDGDTELNVKNSGIIERMNLTPPYKFAFITDTQGALNETSDALDIIRARGDISFVIHGGDQTDFGLPKEFMWCRDMMEATGLPYVTVIGNHDCLGNGNDTFAKIYGPDNFSFNAGPVHFVCLNTVALEYDYSHPVPDLGFIKQDFEAVASINQTSPGTITHTVVVMHSQPYDFQFNNNVAEPFDYYLSFYPGLGKNDDRIPSDGGISDTGTVSPLAKGFCINGHNHATDISDLFGNGILYYQCANIAKRTFFVFTITDDGYEFEKVDF